MKPLTNETLSNPSDITLASIREAIEEVKFIPKKQWIVASKKHTKLIAKQCLQIEPKNPMGLSGSLFGINLFTKLYLKKVRIYTEK